jgi:hypothetical protein
MKRLLHIEEKVSVLGMLAFSFFCLLMNSPLKGRAIRSHISRKGSSDVGWGKKAQVVLL